MPVASLQPGIKKAQNQFFCAAADSVDPKNNVVHCSDEGSTFNVKYDVLAIATGSQVPTGPL